MYHLQQKVGQPALLYFPVLAIFSLFLLSSCMHDEGLISGFRYQEPPVLRNTPNQRHDA